MTSVIGKICVVGLGYVGLPLAILLAEKYEVHGFDINKEKIALLRQGKDPTKEVGESVKTAKVRFHETPNIISECNFIIVAVPTPVDKNVKPDISMIVGATETIAKYMKPGTIVCYESTVWPGLTEEICLPILEKSGLKYGKEFKLAYSPERMNPGDKVHTVDKIVKVVSGSDAQALEVASEIYGSITKIHKAPTIKTAEAAKVIENIQRDLNIALVNELSIIFHNLGIDTHDVLDAAATKWNFHKYTPGLVGGHCIGVDPYYLTYKAQQARYDPRVILAGRGLNEYMIEYVANLVVKELSKGSKPIKDCVVYVLGLTFKENVNDLRNSKILELIKMIKEWNIKVIGFDPYVTSEDVAKEGVRIKFKKPSDVHGIDLVVLGSFHSSLSYVDADLLHKMMKNPVVIDIKGTLPSKSIEDITYIRL